MSGRFARGLEHGVTGCHCCGLLVRLDAAGGGRCPRCHSPLHPRLPDSLARTWALLITAALLYIPANSLPVMHTAYLGNAHGDTIMSGVVYFLFNGDWPLALVIFTASILIPLVKMLALGYLLVTVQRRSTIRQRERTLLYRVTELVGRWSMVDVFVVAVLAALVQMGQLASIQPGAGATAFGGVVVLTMLAAQSFDPRLIWDHQEALHE